MENTDKQVAEPLLQKFTILSIKGLGHYRCNIKKLQAYLNGNHVTVSPNILPADQDSWTGNTNQTIFTRQSKPMSTKFFSAVPQLSGNEQIYRHSSCAPQTVRQRKDISPLNILEYRSCCTK
ncbi:hypothetical protein DPMN_089055 [Dreissena polymorpha]|uniref:Uncharacterized protein n=1 Tax=Dreissena polymorpha TaxID=45954 RepID=A0A9D4QYG4_DREPO|nr:hypothetical protein DPMN_089055 [Dreissena polymorpha]